MQTTTCDRCLKLKKGNQLYWIGVVPLPAPTYAAGDLCETCYREFASMVANWLATVPGVAEKAILQ